jgi:NAD(P)-dependent dehydrogenase (short-subunit alcohol dehydrogenase family)
LFDLAGKIAVVTGAASGIGASTARRFAGAGATVVLADIVDASELAGVIGGRYVRTDVASEDEVRALMAAAGETLGRIDICVNNVGIGTGSLLVDAEGADFLEAFRVNTLGTLFGIKHVVPYMSGGGAIVNTASIAGVVGYPTYGAYAASKFGVVGLTKIAALELGSLGIRVNCVCPSAVNTPQLAAQSNRDSEVAALGSMAGYQKLIEPEEVAAAMHFLVADDCPVVSGVSLVLDGAATAGVSPTIIGLAEDAFSGGPPGYQ